MKEENYFESREFLDRLHAYEDARRNGKPVFLDSGELGEIAEYYRREGQLERSLETVDYALERFPGAPEPLMFRARHALYIEGDIDKADAYAEQMTEKETSDYVYLKFEIMLNREQVEEADKKMREILEDVDKKDYERLILDTADTYLEFHLADKARSWFELLPDKTTTSARCLEGRIANAMGIHNAAEEIYRELTEDYPYEDSYWMDLGFTQFSAGKYDEALESCDFALAINPDNVNALVVKGHIYLSMFKYEEALEYYTRYNEQQHGEDSGELNIALTLNEMERFKDAIEHFAKAEKMAGARSELLEKIYEGMSRALSKTGDMEGAFKYLDRYWALNDKDDDSYQIDRARILMENKQLEEAALLFMKTLEKKLKHPKEAPYVLYKFATAAYETRLIPLAYETYKQLFTLVKNPNWPIGNSQFAACCHILGKKEEVGPALKRACLLNPTEAREVLHVLFPDEIPPEEYYDYYQRWLEEGQEQA